MHLDRDGIIALVLGILLILGVFVGYGGLQNPVKAVVDMLITGLVGGIIILGVVFILVGVLFMVAW